MKPMRITGMMILSLCWITCVVVSVGATAAPGQDQIRVRDTGLAVGTGQVFPQGPAGQTTGPAEAARSPGQGNAAGRGTGSGQDPGNEYGNITEVFRGQKTPYGGAAPPAGFDRGNMTEAGHGPFMANMTHDSRPACPEGMNCTEIRSPLNGWNITGLQEPPLFENNATAGSPPPDPYDGTGPVPGMEPGNYDTDGAGLQDTGTGYTGSAASQSGEMSRDQVTSIIQSFLTWLNAQARG